MNPIRRRRLHQRIGETLERLHAASRSDATTPARANGHAQDLAYHFTQAGDLAGSLAYSRRAAQNAERVFAHDEALKFLAQARESAEALGLTDELTAIDEDIGDIHEARGVIRLAVESYERALVGATTREARAALKAKVGNAYVPIGDPRGLAHLEEALAELNPETQTDALALATGLVGRYYHYRTEHRKAIEFLERARQLAEPLGNAQTIANIYTYLAGAHQHLLLYDESDRWAQACIALGERERLPSAIASGNEFLSENAAGRGHWDASLAFAEKDAEHGRRIGSVARVAWSRFCAAQGLHGKGELAGALDVTLAGLESCEQIGEDRLATWLDPYAAIIAADLGDENAARDHAERAWSRCAQLNQLVLSAWALNGLGYSALKRGDTRTALEWFEKFVSLVADTENAVARHLVIGRAAEAFLRAGRLDTATRAVEQAIALAQFGKSPHYLALALRVQGEIFAAQGRYDDASRTYDEALAALEPIGSRLELARTLYHRAALRLKRGEREAAFADAAHARDAFDEMGAVGDRTQAQQLLAESR